MESVRQLRQLPRLQGLLSDVHVTREKRGPSFAYRIRILPVGLSGRRHTPARTPILRTRLHNHNRSRRTHTDAWFGCKRRYIYRWRPGAGIVGTSEGIVAG